MPRALAIETSSRVGSVALAEDGRVVAEEQFAHGLQHAAQIIPIIDRLCRAHGWTPPDLEHVYVSAGPGSFTGLRIGVTLAKTMALATGAKLVAVQTARVLAENAPAAARHLVIVLDAKRDQIFTARLERASDGWLERVPVRVASLTEMLDGARDAGPVHLLGEGIPYHEKFIPKDDPRVIVTPPELWRPRAAVVAQLGWAHAQRGEFADPDRLTPTYVRVPEAEEKYEAGRR